MTKDARPTGISDTGEAAAEVYGFLTAAEAFENLSPNQALNRLAVLIDLSLDRGQMEGLQLSLKQAKRLPSEDFSSEQVTILNYFLSNAWANIRTLRNREAAAGRDDSQELAWEWEQQETEKQIYYLRLALTGEGFDGISKRRQCEILTNLANLYDTVGRFAEGIEYWDRATDIIPSFGEALGNRGIGLVNYARCLYDPGHQATFLQVAHRDLSAGLGQELHPDARARFEEFKAYIESVLPSESLSQPVHLDGYALGETDEEVEYREWCLENRLFLNPLNDLGPHNIGAQDVFTAPDIVYGLRESPYYHGYFNQLKQEFVSARYIYYVGLRADSPHFSDKEVLLYNTLDYPAYSLAVERTKAAFRMAYSLLDKLAYFLTNYYGLSINKRRVSFRRFWYKNTDHKKGLWPEFVNRPNWPLRGLFWLSKDLFEDKSGFKDSTEPDAQELTEVRNCLEHRYLKLHDSIWWGLEDEAKKNPEVETVVTKNPLALSLYRCDFEAKVVRLLKMTRAALIYLSLAIHREESEVDSDQGSDRIVVPHILDTWEDRWKF